jgi:hypothetical protein
MTSIYAHPKQTVGHFMALSTFFSSATLLTYSGDAGKGAQMVPGSFTPAAFANSGDGAGISSLLGPMSLFKDMGKNVLSSNRLFRKVALVSTNMENPFATGGAATQSFGVVMDANGNPLTGYIELGYEGFGTAARVAKFDNL